MKNFVIVKTGGNNSFSARIASSIRWSNQHLFRKQKFRTFVQEYNNIDLTGLNPEDTVIHVRAAYPSKTGWIKELFDAEENGFRVINKPEVLILTANKLACALALQKEVSHPKTWEYTKGDDVIALCANFNSALNFPEYIIAKPITSMEQGANVKKINVQSLSVTRFGELLNEVPGEKIVVQEYIPYTAIYRVIVIDGQALPYVFVDKPEWHPSNWKVSVCLNKTTMRFIANPSVRLTRLAETAQDVIGGEINFIDVFETNLPNRKYVISEINTACTLNIHERLAHKAGHEMANIHYRIAKYLIHQALEG